MLRVERSSIVLGVSASGSCEASGLCPAFCNPSLKPLLGHPGRNGETDPERTAHRLRHSSSSLCQLWLKSPVSLRCEVVTTQCLGSSPCNSFSLTELCYPAHLRRGCHRSSYMRIARLRSTCISPPLPAHSRHRSLNNWRPRRRFPRNVHLWSEL